MATYIVLKVDTLPDDPAGIVGASVAAVMTGESVDATKKDLIERGVSDLGRFVVVRVDDLKIFATQTAITAV